MAEVSGLRIAVRAPGVFVVLVHDDEIGEIRQVEGGFKPDATDGLWSGFQATVGFLVFRAVARHQLASDRLLRALFSAQERGQIVCPQEETK